MNSAHIAQLAAALIAAATPWIVVRIGFWIAAGHARSVPAPISRPAVMTTLDRLTAVSMAGAGALALALPAPSLWMGLFDLAVFGILAGVGLKALGAVEAISRPAREATAAVREASLRPRRLRDYVPAAWRVLLFSSQGAALAWFAWRLALPGADRRLLVPVMFALGAPVFTWLYEVWMRDLVARGHVATGDVEAQRRRRIRAVFVMEIVLAATCLGVGHALLDLDWDHQAAWGAGLSLAGAVVGVLGCALCVSSGLAVRRYRVV
jgi:hypothetical protein